MQRGKVVVTGASTGIGEATALRLKAAGFQVLAGVRRDEDAERMRAQGLEPVMLDVTDEAQVRALAEASDELAGLVNNAGISVAAPLEFLPLDQLRRQIEVNVIGQVAVTQALLPALRAAKGRIVNISSVGGKVALPLVGAYNASKFALEALSDALRRELRDQGVSVSVVEPGGIRTPIWDKASQTADDMAADMPPEAERLYGELIAAVRAQATRISQEGLPPDAVAQAVERAMTAKRPKTRYVVGNDARGRIVAAKVLPDKAFDAMVARALRH